RLATLGTVLTAVVAGLAAALLFDFSALEGLLLGAILASTDGAAIFAVLRGSALRRRLAGALEGEAGLNDPVAVLLVLGFIDWIAHVAMFLTLGLLVFPSQLGDVAVEGAVLAVVVAVLARPLGVAASTVPGPFSWRERAVLGWAGLRGAVPVVLATFPVLHHV